MLDPKKMAAYVNEGAPPEAEEGEPVPEEGSAERYAKLIPLLEEFADVIVEVSDEVDAEMLLDPEAEMAPDDAEILRSGIATLDSRLQKALKVVAAAGPISFTDAEYLAEHLASEGMIDDAARIAGWIFRAGALLTPAAPPEDEMSEEEEEPEEEEPEI